MSSPRVGFHDSVLQALNSREQRTNSWFLTTLIGNGVILFAISLHLCHSAESSIDDLYELDFSCDVLVFILEVFVAVICFFNLVCSSIAWALACFTSCRSIPLTPAQKKLLSISNDDSMFIAPAASPAKNIKSCNLNWFSWPDLRWLFGVTRKKRHTPEKEGRSQLITDANRSPVHMNCSAYGSFLSERSLSPAAMINGRLSPSTFSFHEQQHMQTSPDVRQRSDESLLFSSCSSPNSSFRLRSPYSSPASSADSYDRSRFASALRNLDVSNLLSFKYESSPSLNADSSHLQRSMDATTSRLPNPMKTVIWARYNVDMNKLNEQTQNLRLWISATILKPLVREIDYLNSKASVAGRPDFTIGVSSLQTLHTTVRTKSDQYPTLYSLLPYLELSASQEYVSLASNQEYLVQRLRELGDCDACINEFQWNGGGKFKDKPWEDRMPTDSELILHFLCTYLDSRLTPHPFFPEGKSFTAQYYVPYIGKPKTGKGILQIHQRKISPPDYRLIVEDEEIDVKPGKNNLFYVVLLFFHHLKMYRDERLDSVTLGASGLNILWVLK